MKIATLAIILRGDKVLLGYKKTGEIGARTLNGPGGKCEDGETPVACVVRETKEEIDIELSADHLEEVAVITFHFAHVADFQVHVFLTTVFSGMPSETDVMVPSWHNRKNLPFERMLESDREWFPKAITGEKFRANVYYKQRAKEFERIEFFPY